MLEGILGLLTDGLHREGFVQQSQILAILLQVVTTNFITEALDLNQGNISNQNLVYNQLENITLTNFNVNKEKNAEHIWRLFNTCGNLENFQVNFF